MSVIPESHPLRQFFTDLVGRHYAEEIGIRDPQLVAYVSQLLTEFCDAEQLFKIRNGANRPLNDVGEMLLESDPVYGPAPSFDRERQVRKHIGDFTLFFAGMLPSEDAIVVGEELQQRFGLPFWQFALTATDANRFSIRLARHITGRPKILVFNWCYHGTVDETFITLQDGVAKARRGNVGPPVDPAVTTAVVEFNDLSALEGALKNEDIACVLAEPALTNVGIVLPDPGYDAALREITRKHGTLLIIDETHTICAGPGGYTRAENLEPDFLVFGKPIAGGVPGAAYGFTAEVAQCIADRQNLEDCDTGGIGGTLAGNALSLAAMKATLQKVLTKDAFDRMIPMAERWTDGVAKVISEFELPWNVTRLGCRAEYLFASKTPRNGTEAHDAMDFELERFMHLYAMPVIDHHGTAIAAHKVGEIHLAVSRSHYWLAHDRGDVHPGVKRALTVERIDAFAKRSGDRAFDRPQIGRLVGAQPISRRRVTCKAQRQAGGGRSRESRILQSVKLIEGRIHL